jgi:tetratricopeptide (TPR) repeat protein
MSSTAKQEAKAAEEGGAETDVCCANCGAAEIDDIKLEECTDCDLVKYCGDKCQENHREEHEEECKNRKTVLHDRKLFTQPDETHLGECPLCFLPLPFDGSSMFRTCCSEMICIGCVYANHISNIHDKAKRQRCPFCREPANDDENDKRMMKRIKANDPVAMNQMGVERHLKGDYDSALEHLTKAAELGNADAHYTLGLAYMKGEGVEKDEEKAVYHWEKAAIGGHPLARHNLCVIEEMNGNMERSVKHLIIAANLGYENSMKSLWGHYSRGNITKEDLDATLRAHQAAIDAMKSAQRDAAEATGVFK